MSAVHGSEGFSGQRSGQHPATPTRLRPSRAVDVTTPPARLRELLVEERGRGAAFADAWPRALESSLAGARESAEWCRALEDTRVSWQGAYGYVAAPKRERALAALGGDPERVVELAPVIASGVCAHCGGPVPPARRRGALYCSHPCQRAANGRRVAA